MEWDEVEPGRSRKPGAGTIAVGEPLAGLSVAELEARIGALTAEIERVKAELERKRSMQSAAESLFKR